MQELARNMPELNIVVITIVSVRLSVSGWPETEFTVSGYNYYDVEESKIFTWKCPGWIFRVCKIWVTDYWYQHTYHSSVQLSVLMTEKKEGLNKFLKYKPNSLSCPHCLKTTVV